jgi:hypothetical protein
VKVVNNYVDLICQKEIKPEPLSELTWALTLSLLLIVADLILPSFSWF